MAGITTRALKEAAQTGDSCRAPGGVISGQYQTAIWATKMTLVFLLAFIWLSARTVLLLAQVERHTPEAQLGREFHRELRERGLFSPEHLQPKP